MGSPKHRTPLTPRSSPNLSTRRLIVDHQLCISSTHHQPIINLSTHHQPIINLSSTYHQTIMCSIHQLSLTSHTQVINQNPPIKVNEHCGITVEFPGTGVAQRRYRHRTLAILGSGAPRIPGVFFSESEAS